MKSFGKKPATILAAGSLALAMTSCQPQSTQNRPDSSNTSASTNQFWNRFVEKISETIRGGFGNSAPSDNSTNRKEDEDEIYEDEGAGG